MSVDNLTALYAIKHGTDPDWNAAAKAVDEVGLHPELVETYSDYARERLRESVDEMAEAWNEGKGSLMYDVRRMPSRGVDLHTVSTTDDTDLYFALSDLDVYAPIAIVAAGFDHTFGSDASRDDARAVLLVMREDQVVEFQDADSDGTINVKRNGEALHRTWRVTGLDGCVREYLMLTELLDAEFGEQ